MLFLGTSPWYSIIALGTWLKIITCLLSWYLSSNRNDGNVTVLNGQAILHIGLIIWGNFEMEKEGCTIMDKKLKAMKQTEATPIEVAPVSPAPTPAPAEKADKTAPEKKYTLNDVTNLKGGDVVYMGSVRYTVNRVAMEGNLYRAWLASAARGAAFGFRVSEKLLSRITNIVPAEKTRQRTKKAPAPAEQDKGVGALPGQTVVSTWHRKTA